MKQTLQAAALGVAAVATAGALSSPAAADSTACSTGTLPPVVQGDPHVSAGAPGGFYLWHGSNGFALRVTHASTQKMVFSGRLTASAGFSHVQRVALEGSDTVGISSDHKTLIFRFSNYGRIDGINFSANCSKTMRVDLRIAGSRAATKQIKLGAHRVSPTSNPFVIERTTAAG